MTLPPGRPSSAARYPPASLAKNTDITIRRYAERDAPVTHWTELDRGGNFLALEQPSAYTEDVRAFFANR